METTKHIMIDLELERQLLSCQSLLPNMTLLKGPLEILFHIYVRNNQDHLLVRQALVLSFANQLSDNTIVLLYLERYGSEYLHLVGQMVGKYIKKKDFEGSLKCIRHTRHQLPSSLCSLGLLFSELHCRRSNINRILFDSWITPYLRNRFPDDKVFLDSLFDWENQMVDKHLQVFIEHFMKGKSAILKGCTPLERTDSVSEVPYVLTSSSGSVSNSSGKSSSTASASSPSASAFLRSTNSRSKSATPSPELALFENSKECCLASNTHQQILVRWLIDNRTSFKAWLYDGQDFKSEDGIFDSRLKNNLRNAMSKELNHIIFRDESLVVSAALRLATDLHSKTKNKKSSSAALAGNSTQIEINV